MPNNLIRSFMGQSRRGDYEELLAVDRSGAASPTASNESYGATGETRKTGRDSLKRTAKVSHTLYRVIEFHSSDEDEETGSVPGSVVSSSWEPNRRSVASNNSSSTSSPGICFQARPPTREEEDEIAVIETEYVYQNAPALDQAPRQVPQEQHQVHQQAPPQQENARSSGSCSVVRLDEHLAALCESAGRYSGVRDYARREYGEPNIAKSAKIDFLFHISFLRPHRDLARDGVGHPPLPPPPLPLPPPPRRRRRRSLRRPHDRPRRVPRRIKGHH